MITTKRIDSMEGIKDLIFEQEYNSSIDRTRSSYFYRGIPDASYRISTGLRRNCKEAYQDLEMPLLENFIKNVRIEDPDINESIWKAMVVGQHYGLPTRLVDWTHSTLVALHFANAEDNLEMLSRRDCAVWRIDMTELNEKLPPRYRAMLEKKKTSVLSLEELCEIAPTIAQYDQDMGSAAMVCFEPPSVDQRIVNQYSFFSIIPNGVEDIEHFLDAYTGSTVKYIISKSLRWQVRDTIDQFNINERMIYPGKAGIAKWLARHYFVKGRD